MLFFETENNHMSFSLFIILGVTQKSRKVKMNKKLTL